MGRPKLSAVLTRENLLGRASALIFSVAALAGLAAARWAWGEAAAPWGHLAVLPVLALAWRRGVGAAFGAAGAFGTAWALPALASGPAAGLDAALLTVALAAPVGAIAAGNAALAAERNKALVDPLTGVWNLRSFYRFAEIELSRFKRTRRPFTLLCIDLDGFTLLNSRTDSANGDDLLRCCAAAVKKSVRVTDIVARVGPDEFAVLMPETAGEKADLALARLVGDVQKKLQQFHWAVTFSIGAITFESEPNDVEDIVRRIRGMMQHLRDGQGRNRSKRTVC